LRIVAEDVGRHNTVDKLWGKAMLAGEETAGSLLVTTGRISVVTLDQDFVERGPAEKKCNVASTQPLEHRTDRSLRFDRAADDDVGVDDSPQFHSVDALRTPAMASSISAAISSSL
jgi:hypothetical protein